jgi:hypothetical protein
MDGQSAFLIFEPHVRPARLLRMQLMFDNYLSRR